MKKLIFTGCSFTAGNGWVDADRITSALTEVKNSQHLYVNLCHSQIDQYKNLELINAGKGGASCADIFQTTVNLIATHGADIDTVFCQWTSMPRYRIHMGFELWRTDTELARFQMRDGHGLSQRNQGRPFGRGKSGWDDNYVNDVLDRFLALHHLHYEIVKLLKYCNILKKLADQFAIKLYFINGLCPWDQDYFVRLKNVLPENYTPFTKKNILEIDSRDDEETYQLYELMHNEYDEVGGIQSDRWINLYSSMMHNRIDKNFDQVHPGIKSNQLYFQQIKSFLDNQ